MATVPAPPAGWYPDPEGGSRLRWWVGTDWSDRYRPPPTPSELQRTGRYSEAAGPPVVAATGGPTSARGALSRHEVQEIVVEVRNAARAEVDRAADVFTQRAHTATREIRPLVTEYTNQILRWVRIIAVLIVVAIVAWFVFETIVQVSFFEWLGDRIDNLSN